MTRIVILSVLIVLFACVVYAAPRTQNGRQLSFDADSDTPPTTDDEQRPKGFITRIFDVIKSLFGLQSRRTVMRSDGTIVELEPESQGIVARITRRVLGIVSKILGTFINTGTPEARVEPAEESRYRAAADRTNEIERELIRQKPGTNRMVVQS